MILRRDHAADHHHHVGASQLTQFIHELRQQCFVPRRERANTNDMHIVFHRPLGYLGRRLKQGRDIDIEAQISEGGGDDFGAAVMPILAHLRHHQTRTATLAQRKVVRQLADSRDILRLAKLAAVDTGNGSNRCLMPPPDLL